MSTLNIITKRDAMRVISKMIKTIVDNRHINIIYTYIFQVGRQPLSITNYCLEILSSLTDILKERYHIVTDRMLHPQLAL